MAQIVAELTFETELLHDLVGELGHIVQALAHRHGDAFRQLDRDIDEWIELTDWRHELTFAPLECGRQILLPPSSGVALVDRARRLGL